MVYESSDVARGYNRGRDLPPETLQLWLEVLGEYVPGPVSCLLDLGCGTGRFSGPLADYLHTRVIGVDPSLKMLGQAPEKHRGQAISLIVGVGEGLPLRSDLCEVVFLSMAYHHLSDKPRALSEMLRVLQPGGRLLIRTSTQETLGHDGWIEHFPEAAQIELARTPSHAEYRHDLEAAGFHVLEIRPVMQFIAATWGEYYEKIAARSLSSLNMISDEAFEQGCARWHRFCEPHWDEPPVLEEIDLIVAGKAP